jgi:hypothetical protein
MPTCFYFNAEHLKEKKQYDYFSLWFDSVRDQLISISSTLKANAKDIKLPRGSVISNNKTIYPAQNWERLGEPRKTIYVAVFVSCGLYYTVPVTT